MLHALIIKLPDSNEGSEVPTRQTVILPPGPVLPAYRCMTTAIPLTRFFSRSRQSRKHRSTNPACVGGTNSKQNLGMAGQFRRTLLSFLIG